MIQNLSTLCYIDTKSISVLSLISFVALVGKGLISKRHAFRIRTCDFYIYLFEMMDENKIGMVHF